MFIQPRKYCLSKGYSSIITITSVHPVSKVNFLHTYTYYVGCACTIGLVMLSPFVTNRYIFELTGLTRNKLKNVQVVCTRMQWCEQTINSQNEKYESYIIW